MDGPQGEASTRSNGWFTTASKLLVVAAALTSAGAVLLHLCGYVAQRTYLWTFNVDPDAFPRSTDWLVVNGYYSIIDVGLSIFENSIGWPTIAAIGYLTLVIAIFRWKPRRRVGPKLLVRLQESAAFQLWGVSALFSGLAFFVFYFALPVALIFIMVPAVAGETFGERTATKRIAQYQKGCTSTNPCTELWRDGARTARGFVIASSTERVALYDVDHEVVRQLESAGLELRSALGPKFDSRRKD